MSTSRFCWEVLPFPCCPWAINQRETCQEGRQKAKQSGFLGWSKNAGRTSLGSTRLRGPCGRWVPQSRSLRRERVGLGLRSWLRSGNKVPGLCAGGSRMLLSLPLPDLCNRILVQPVCGAAWASAFLTSSQETLLRCSGTTLRAERGLTRQTVWI